MQKRWRVHAGKMQSKARLYKREAILETNLIKLIKSAKEFERFHPLNCAHEINVEPAIIDHIFLSYLSKMTRYVDLCYHRKWFDNNPNQNLSVGGRGPSQRGSGIRSWACSWKLILKFLNTFEKRLWEKSVLSKKITCFKRYHGNGKIVWQWPVRHLLNESIDGK